jgi:hypothetical protein
MSGTWPAAVNAKSSVASDRAKMFLGAAHPSGNQSISIEYFGYAEGLSFSQLINYSTK